MKLMIASDLHGSARDTRDLLAAFDREGAEKLLLLGDLLYHGPRNDLPGGYAPKEVIGLLNGRKEQLLCVRGNCDGEVDQMVLEFPILAEYTYLCVNGWTIFATHGHHHGFDDLPPLNPGEVLLCGHTHVTSWTPFGEGNWYWNPGSVSLPKKGTKKGYILLTEDGTVIWRTLEGENLHQIRP